MNWPDVNTCSAGSTWDWGRVRKPPAPREDGRRSLPPLPLLPPLLPQAPPRAAAPTAPGSGGGTAAPALLPLRQAPITQEAAPRTACPCAPAASVHRSDLALDNVPVEDKFQDLVDTGSVNV